MTIELTGPERAAAAAADAHFPYGLERAGLAHFDRDGDPITCGEWTVLFARGDAYARVEFDRVGRFEVSTVWLGLNLGVFETMVFDGDSAIHTERYATKTDARVGHARILAEFTAIAGTQKKEP